LVFLFENIPSGNPARFFFDRFFPAHPVNPFNFIAVNIDSTHAEN
jgi:hypothetical protein